MHGKPDVVAEAPLYSVKITRVMITEQQGRHLPHFLEDVSGDTQTVNAQQYRAVLAKFRRAFKTKQKNDMKALQYSWFQQDGVQPTPPKKPRIGYRSASGSAWCQCLRRAPDHPAPRTWPHHNSFCGVTSSLTYRSRSSRSLWDPKEAVKSVLGCVPPPCAALRRRPRCAELNCASSETGVTANTSSARPAKCLWALDLLLKSSDIFRDQCTTTLSPTPEHHHQSEVRTTQGHSHYWTVEAGGRLLI